MSAVTTREQVFAWLEDVKDPEVPVLSVVELGVVRDATVSDDGSVAVTITPTYSGCPAMRVIEESIRDALLLRGAPRVTVATVFSPAWTTDWMPETARAKLEAYGIAPPGAVDPVGDLVPLQRAGTGPRCPFCKSPRTTRRSDFGSTACKALWVCEECTQPFEQFKAI
ncbi:MAG: phenylacetate-CoA oxygenase subunit PaaJ [Gemmatimonadetes bacterium]|nr:phenylacetate-CoA oxygenase subunit PaaJ [Gemmatimonadota bacterium]